jgi:hypothetical protein
MERVWGMNGEWMGRGVWGVEAHAETGQVEWKNAPTLYHTTHTALNVVTLYVTHGGGFLGL